MKHDFGVRGRDTRGAGRARLGRLAGLTLLLAALIGSAPADALNPKDRHVVGDAFRAANAGDWQRAFGLVEPVRDPLPQKTLRWLRMMDEQGPAGFTDYARFLLANPHWPLPEEMLFLAERRIVDPADHALIRRLFERWPPLTTRGHIRYAQALFEVGRDAQATGLIRKAWIEGDFSSTEGRKFHQRYGHLLSEDDHVARLDNLLWDYRRRSAARMLERVPAGHRRLAEARLRLQRRQHGVDAAIAAVPGALRNDPGLLFDRLRWRRQKRRHESAMEILLDPPAELGRPSMWWFEREFQIRRALRDRDFALAYRLAGRHGQTEGADFAEAEWLAGWLALRFMDQPREALRRFERLFAGVTSPISRARAAYWAGRAASALANSELAQAWYEEAAALPITFYGQHAAAELGRELPELDVPPARRGERAAFEGKEVVRVARMLIEVGAHDQLHPFLIRLADDAGTPREVGLVGELAAQSRRPDLVALAGKYAGYHGVINPEVAFPIPAIDAFTEPRPGEPDPALVLAVARQESVFDTRGVSRAGARGLLQLMPNTARLMARELGVAYNRGLLTGDPDYNVRLGRHYLGRLLDRYDAAALALAAYNAGPSRVGRWLDLHGDPRGDRHALIDWLELIPFDETRNYVQRVLENHGVYRARLADDEPVLVSVQPVNGPIVPAPMPGLKPVTLAAHSQPAAPGEPVDNAPTPRLKPKAAQIIPAGFEPPPLPRLKPGRMEQSAGSPPMPEPNPAHLAAAPRPTIKPSGG